MTDEEKRLHEQARADEALRVLHHRPRRRQLEEPAAKRTGMGEVIGIADMADDPVCQALAIGLIQAQWTHNACPLSFESRERHRANARTDVGLDNAARIVSASSGPT